MQTIEEKSKINYPENSENKAVNLSQKRQQKAFIKGFLNCQKEYDWIPIEEIKPEDWLTVQIKYMYLDSIMVDSAYRAGDVFLHEALKEMDEHFKHVTVIAWRPLFL